MATQIPKPPDGVEDDAGLRKWLRETPTGQLVEFLKHHGASHIAAHGAAAHLTHLVNGVTLDDWQYVVRHAIEHDGNGPLIFETDPARGDRVQSSAPLTFPDIGTPPKPEDDITEWILSQSVDDLRTAVRESFYGSKFLTEEDVTILVAFLRRAKRHPITRAEYLDQDSAIRRTLNLRVGLAAGTIEQTGVDNYEARYIVHQIQHDPFIIVFTAPLVATITKDEHNRFTYRLHSYDGIVREGTNDVPVQKNGNVDMEAISPGDDWRDARTTVFQEFIHRYESGDEEIRNVVARFGSAL